MYFRILLFALIIYLLYRLVFNFIIPIYKTTRQVKSQFKDLHSRMQEQMNQQEKFQNSSSASKTETPKKPEGDYIDFEEVK